jgi:hypothetical protein
MASGTSAFSTGLSGRAVVSFAPVLLLTITPLTLGSLPLPAERLNHG